MTTTFTKNFRLPKADFTSEPWQASVTGSYDAIDDVLFNILSSANIHPWANSTVYSVGMLAADNASGQLYMVVTAHTSAASPTTFGTDRTNNPSFWANVQLSIRPRGQWFSGVIYQVNDIVYDTTGGRNVFALCKTLHISGSDIISDSANWTFIFNGATLTTALAVSYDHTASGLIAVSVQTAIDEVVVNLGNRVRVDGVQSFSAPQKLQGRQNLGLGTSSTFDAGTAANNMVQMVAGPKLPAIDGSLLTNVIAAGAVTQGGGPGQQNNVIKIGWDGVSKIKIAVDVTDEGAIFTTTTLPAISGGGTANYLRADGSWAIPPGTLVSKAVFSGSQTVTIPATATKAYVKMWGPTGGSGGINANGTGASTGGTGGGGYLEKYLTGLTPGNTFVYTEGGAGAAGTSGGGNGGNGGNSTLASGTQSISTLTCNGSTGSLGNGTQATTTAGTPGGTASGGDLNIAGLGGTPVNALAVSTISTNPGVTGDGKGFGAFGLAQLTASTVGNAGQLGKLQIEWYV